MKFNYILFYGRKKGGGTSWELLCRLFKLDSAELQCT